MGSILWYLGIMNNQIKLSFSFPKPYEQFSQKNYRTRRKEEWRKRQAADSSKITKGGRNDAEHDVNSAIQFILKDRDGDLDSLLKNKRCANILGTTELELSVTTTRREFRTSSWNHNITAKIRLLHLAVIERRYNCLSVMLKVLKEISKPPDLFYEPITRS
eukprot:TRINITY_DN21341_c0_g1_i1.p1 TRINITY_DN21341_c0_g1~~TRINITY_DN21341_c0_g1_i1.p1  ORF type:complete len:180 (+),score=19.49 TRINITY_DN21341_c0_g1_i1:58-540(+)